MMADIHALFFGDGNPAGTGMTDESKRWPQILAAALSLTSHVYAVEGAGYTVQAKSVLAQLTVAAADIGVPADSVGLVVLAAGYEDAKAKADISVAASQVFAIATAIRKRYKNAKLAIMVGPQGLEPDGFGADYESFLKGLSAACRTVGADVVVDAWDWLFGKTDDVQSDKVHPNEAGHALIATQIEPLIPDIDVPEPPDLTPVEPLGIRKYAPGRADPNRDERRGEQRRNKEKNQANNSTGSETEQTTIKLNALTKQLQEQQALTTGLTGQLAQSQQQLQAQQRELKRVTPTYSTVSGDSPGGSLGSDWTTLVSLTAHPDLSDGKARAQLTIGVSAIKPGDGMPLLECLVGGSRVGTFPGVTANGDSFGGTTIAYVAADQPVVLRGKSTVDDASPVGQVHMSMTVMNLA
jgi:lysophospholipase L1-like esterase